MHFQIQIPKSFEYNYLAENILLVFTYFTQDHIYRFKIAKIVPI